MVTMRNRNDSQEPCVSQGCRDRSPAVRDGNLTLLVHLPVTCKRDFETHLETTLPCVLEGIADEAEEVRNLFAHAHVSSF